jgi:hypothetical protein
MNAQAIELYKQALEFAYTTIGKDHADTSYFQGTVAGKFAELIVREMCDVFDKRAEPGTGFYEPHEPAELIKQHFGVEE